MSDATGVSATSVHRIWRSFVLKPHLQDTFKLSTDPHLVDKVCDVVGLYLNPPDRARHNEKPQPFVWCKTADQIIAAVGRAAEQLT